jgi:hypothetical protein
MWWAKTQFAGRTLEMLKSSSKLQSGLDCAWKGGQVERFLRIVDTCRRQIQADGKAA